MTNFKTVIDIKNEKDNRKYNFSIQGTDPATGKLLFTKFFKNIIEAKEATKNLYACGFKGNIHGYHL